MSLQMLKSCYEYNLARDGNAQLSFLFLSWTNLRLN